MESNLFNSRTYQLDQLRYDASANDKFNQATWMPAPMQRRRKEDSLFLRPRKIHGRISGINRVNSGKKQANTRPFGHSRYISRLYELFRQLGIYG